MKYDVNDIEVFITSHERPKLIRETLDSFLSQTIKGFDITVVDNSIENNMLSELDDYIQRGVSFFSNNTHVNLPIDNFDKVRQLAKRKWIIVFHDDDLIHPSYIEHVLLGINKFKNLSLVVTLTSFSTNPDQQKFDAIKDIDFKLISNADGLATAILSGLSIPFGATVYLSEAFKKITPRKEFGKIADRPLMFDCAEGGRVLLLRDNYVQTREHQQRDSHMPETGPYTLECINLLKEYRMRMRKRLFCRSSFIFITRVSKHINEDNCITWKTGDYQNYTMRDYKKIAFEKGAVTRVDYILGYPFYIIWKILNKRN